MKISAEKFAALLSCGLLALTLSACGTEDDTPDPGPGEEASQEQFDTFEDESAPGAQNDDENLQEEQSATPQETGEDPDTAPDEDDPDDDATMNEETQDVEDDATQRGGE